MKTGERLLFIMAIGGLLVLTGIRRSRLKQDWQAVTEWIRPDATQTTGGGDCVQDDEAET